MTLFFTSDLHFGHQNIIKYCNRPFKDVESMNEGLIENWNSVVGPEDEVIVLGDVALGRFKDNISLVLRLNGKKHLVPGNHDRCWDAHSNPQTKDYEDVGFSILPGTCNFPLISKDDNYWVRLSHFPYDIDDRHGSRFTEWQPKDNGQWLLHGHVHDSWKTKDRQINVGVDVNSYRPVSEEEIMTIIQENPLGTHIPPETE